MRSSVDPARESTDHRQSDVGKLIREFFRGFAPIVRRATRTDDAERMMIALLKFAPHVKNDRWRMDFAQRLGIRWRPLRDYGRAKVFDAFQLCRKIDNRFPI